MKYPMIEDAKKVAQQHECEIVIIFFQKDGKVGYSSYGKDSYLCKVAHSIADEMFEDPYRLIVGLCEDCGHPIYDYHEFSKDKEHGLRHAVCADAAEGKI